MIEYLEFKQEFKNFEGKNIMQNNKIFEEISSHESRIQEIYEKFFETKKR